MMKEINIKFLILVLFCGLISGCNITLNQDELPQEVVQLFFEGEQTLNNILSDGKDRLNEVVLTLPPELENDYERANDVCLADGSLDLLVISLDETVQQKLSPYFQFYCDAKSKYHQGTARNIALTKSFSCVAALGDLFKTDLRGGEKKGKIRFSQAKKCFSDPISKSWFEKNIEIDSSEILSLHIKDMSNANKSKFSHLVKFSTNNFNGSIRFRVHKNMSGALLEYYGQEGRVVFGVTTNFLDDQFILRYDLMATNYENKVVDRSRLFLNLKKVDNSILLEDLDFWRLSSNQTKFIIDVVNGGRTFGYRSDRKILNLDQDVIPEYDSMATCISGDQCVNRDIKIPSRERLYQLGNWNFTIESMDKVLDENLIYVHNNAHFGNTPNLKKSSWEILDGPLSYSNRTLMRPIFDKEFIYFVGGKKYSNGEFIDADDAVKLNLKSIFAEKISKDLIPDDLFEQVGSRTLSGVYIDQHINFEFGGFDSGKLVKTGLLKKGDVNISLETLFLNNGLKLDDQNIFPVFSPVVVFTGKHLIVYGGIGYSTDQKITSVQSGFVIDVKEEKAWMMNMKGAPSWVTQGVWAEDRLIVWGGYEINYTNLYPEISVHNRAASYQLGTNSWIKIPSGPLKPRLGHQLVWANDRLVVFSGQNSLGSSNDKNILPVQGAAFYTPGALSKIFFTEVFNEPMSSQVTQTSSSYGEFYLDGDFDLETVLKVYHGSNCQDSNLDEFLSAKIKYYGVGKAKIKFPLERKENWVSVLIKNGDDEICTNSLNFIKL